MFSFTKDIGMDLGTASVLIYIKDKGIVLNEPSVVALDKNTGKLLKVGADAQAMLGRTPGNIIAIRPLREGVISDYEVTERMIKEFLHKVMGFQLFKPRIIICVPSGITEVEERAVIDAGIQAGARRVYLIEEPVAAAIGAGIDITQPEGHMIIDIGGGTSDIAVISLSGVVESSSIKIAGDQFNESVVKYMRRKHNLLVGERTAEQMKMQIGCVFPPEEEMTMEVKGRSLITGLPELISVSSAEMLEAFEEPVERIMEEVHLVLEKTPPELVADISNNGIVMTGGGSLVRGFHRPHRHPRHGGRERHSVRGRGHGQEPRQHSGHAGRHDEPEPPQADQLRKFGRISWRSYQISSRKRYSTILKSSAPFPTAAEIRSKSATCASALRRNWALNTVRRRATTSLSGRTALAAMKTPRPLSCKAISTWSAPRPRTAPRT